MNREKLNTFFLYFPSIKVYNIWWSFLVNKARQRGLMTEASKWSILKSYQPINSLNFLYLFMIRQNLLRHEAVQPIREYWSSQSDVIWWNRQMRRETGRHLRWLDMVSQWESWVHVRGSNVAVDDPVHSDVHNKMLVKLALKWTWVSVEK